MKRQFQSTNRLDKSLGHDNYYTFQDENHYQAIRGLEVHLNGILENKLAKVQVAEDTDRKSQAIEEYRKQRSGKKGDTFEYKQEHLDFIRHEESALVQDYAEAFGDRLVLDAILWMLKEKRDQDLEPIILPMYRLYCCDAILRNAAQYIIHDILTAEQIMDFKKEHHELCEELSEHAPHVIDAFNIPDEMLSAPIAFDWAKFNETDNQGEVDEFSYLYKFQT